MKLGDLVRASALRHPDREAVVCGAERISFAELDRRSNRLANGLLRLGQRPGDRVALYLPNSIELVVAMAALAKSGGVMVPVSTRLAEPEVAYMLSHCEPMAVICSDRLRDAARQGLAGLYGVRLVVAGDDPGTIFGGCEAYLQCADEPPVEGVKSLEADGSGGVLARGQQISSDRRRRQVSLWREPVSWPCG